MKSKTIINSLIIAFILLIIYFVVGHGYVKFFFSGKDELLKTAAYINELCNTKGSCPTNLDGWEAGMSKSSTILGKGNMVYHVFPSVKDKDNKKSKNYQSYILGYHFIMPHWFEAQGGVGKEVTSGWKSH